MGRGRRVYAPPLSVTGVMRQRTPGEGSKVCEAVVAWQALTVTGGRRNVGAHKGSRDVAPGYPTAMPGSLSPESYTSAPAQGGTG